MSFTASQSGGCETKPPPRHDSPALPKSYAETRTLTNVAFLEAMLRSPQQDAGRLLHTSFPLWTLARSASADSPCS